MWIVIVIIHLCMCGSQSLVCHWHQFIFCSEQSLLLLFSAEAINLGPVTGSRGADNTLYRQLTDHEQASGAIRAGVTNMVVSCWRMLPLHVDRLRLGVKYASQVSHHLGYIHTHTFQNHCGKGANISLLVPTKVELFLNVTSENTGTGSQRGKNVSPCKTHSGSENRCLCQFPKVSISVQTIQTWSFQTKTATAAFPEVSIIKYLKYQTSMNTSNLSIAEVTVYRERESWDVRLKRHWKILTVCVNISGMTCSRLLIWT